MVVSDVPAANPRYRYVTVEIQPGAKPGSANVVAVVGRKKIRAEWKLKERRPRAAAPGLSQRDLIYLVTPDRFANGDPSNDYIAGMTERGSDRNDNYKRHGGDLA